MCLPLVCYLFQTKEGKTAYKKTIWYTVSGMLRDALPTYIAATWTQLAALSIYKTTEGLENDEGHTRLLLFTIAAVLAHFVGMIVILRSRKSKIFGFICQSTSEITGWSWMSLTTAVLFGAKHSTVVLFTIFCGMLVLAVGCVYLGGWVRQAVIPRLCNRSGTKMRGSVWYLADWDHESLLTSYEGYVFALALAYLLCQQVYFAIVGSYLTFSAEFHSERDDDDRLTTRFTVLGLLGTLLVVCIWTSIVAWMQIWTDPRGEHRMDEEDIPLRPSEVPATRIQNWKKRRRNRKQLVEAPPPPTSSGKGGTGAASWSLASLSSVSSSSSSASSSSSSSTCSNGADADEAVAQLDVAEAQHSSREEKADDKVIITKEPGHEGQEDAERGKQSIIKPRVAARILNKRVRVVERERTDDMGCCYYWLYKKPGAYLEPLCTAVWGFVCLGLGHVCVSRVQPQLCFWAMGTITMHGMVSLFNTTMAITVAVAYFVYAQLLIYFLVATDDDGRLAGSLLFALFVTNLGLFFSSKLYVRLARRKSTAFRRRRYQLRIVALRLIIGWSWEDVVTQMLEYVKKGNFTIQFTARFLVAVAVTVAAFALEWNKVHRAEKRAQRHAARLEATSSANVRTTPTDADVLNSDDSSSDGESDTMDDDCDMNEMEDDCGINEMADAFGEYGVPIMWHLHDTNEDRSTLGGNETLLDAPLLGP